MAERRSAAAALSLDTKLEEFIKSGMPTPASIPSSVSKMQSPQKKTEIKENAPEKKQEQITVKEKRAAPREKLAETPAEDSPAFARTLARARIQKSIRFLPQLIAKFEEQCRSAELAGKKPISIQDALNEALEMWLRENSK